MPIHLKVSGSGYAPVASPGAADPEVHRLRAREALLNELSAWISVAALVVLLLDESALLFEFATWQTFLPTARNQTTVRRMQDFATGLENTCDVAKLDIAHIDFVSKVNGRDLTYFAMPLAYEQTAFYPSFLLIWVLACSAGFQSFRSTILHRSLSFPAGPPSPGFLRDMAWSFWLALFSHLLLWVKVGSLDTPQVTDGTKFVFLAATSLVALAPHYLRWAYNGGAPDFGRWVEYALTAPLQIVIVACSVWTRDRATLYALLVAQASMILSGALIELNLKRIYKCQHKLQMRETDIDDAPGTVSGNKKLSLQRKRKSAVYETLFTLAVAWVTFAAIWFVIIAQFERLYDNAGRCENCAAHTASSCPVTAPLDLCELAGGACRARNDIPSAVVWIVATQCLLFGLFGLLQSVQIYMSANVRDAARADLTWHAVSSYYAVLSVVAKSTLEIGFLVMLSQMPTSVRRA